MVLWKAKYVYIFDNYGCLGQLERTSTNPGPEINGRVNLQCLEEI